MCIFGKECYPFRFLEISICYVCFAARKYWKSPMNEWRSCRKSSNRCVSWRCTVGKRHLSIEFNAYESNFTFLSPRLLCKDHEYFRREIIETALYKISLSGQMILAHSYVRIAFLLIYGAMWLFDIKLDTRFFAIASCMLVFMQLSVMYFFAFAIRDVAEYFSAQKRIKVRKNSSSLRQTEESFFENRRFCCWKSLNEIIGWCRHRLHSLRVIKLSHWDKEHRVLYVIWNERNGKRYVGSIGGGK